MDVVTSGEHILRIPQVCKKVGLSRSTIYLMVAQGNFPSPVKLGNRSVGWLDSEISSWIDARVR